MCYFISLLKKLDSLLNAAARLRELHVGTFIKVIKISRVKWVWPRKRVIDLGFAGLAILKTSPPFPALLQATLLTVSVRFKSPLHSLLPVVVAVAVQVVVELAWRVALAVVDATVVGIGFVHLWVAIDKNVHLFARVIQKQVGRYIVWPVLALLSHLVDFKFLVSVPGLVICWHCEPWVFQHLLGSGSLVVVPRQHRH